MPEFEDPLRPDSWEGEQRLVRSYASSCLRANLQRTPNEDFLLTDEQSGVFILVDGVTRTNFGENYPSPSPAAMASERFTNSVYESLISADARGLSARERIVEALRAGNAAVGSLNKELFGDSIDYLGADFAGTVGLIALAEGQSLIIGYAGDVRAYGVRNESVDLLTDIQTNKVSQLRKAPDGWSDETTLHIRRDIRNNKGHEMGFGVFTGEESALDFVRILEVPLRQYEYVLLVTDGVAGLAAADPMCLRSEDLESLADQAQQHTKSAGKKVDDIGLILIDCSKYLNALDNKSSDWS